MHPDRYRRWSSSRGDGLGGVQDDAEPSSARVDDPGVGQHLELGGSAGQRLAGGCRSSREHVPGAGSGHPGTRHGRVGCGPGHGQDGALDRLTDRGVRRIGCALHPFGGHDRVAVLARRLGQPGDIRPEHLAQDDAGVAARAEERAASQDLQGIAAVELRVLGQGLHDRVAGRGDREEHVGAGVAVGHGIDVERVDLLAGTRQRVGGDLDETG
jgi:hypothetical protein